MQKPLVTVITVVFNDVSHIEQTMLSVFNQSYPNIEYIVIDGGSTDRTVDVIRKYADRLAYWVSELDGGIYPAMNKGLEHATGEWVSFMNSADAFADNNVLQEIFGEGGNLSIINCQSSIEPLRLIGGNTINFFPDGHEETHHAEPANVIPERLPFSHQASFVKRECCHFDESYRYAADYALFYEIYHKYGPDSIRTINRAIARYRQEDSTTMVNAKKVKGEYLRIQSSHRTCRWWKEYLKWRWL